MARTIARTARQQKRPRGIAPGALYIMGARPNTPSILPERPMRLPRIPVFAAVPAALACLHDRGVDGFFRVFVRADQKKSEINALYAYQGGMSLPSKAYYFDEQFEKFRAAFVEHVAKMLSLAGDAPEAAAVGAKTVFEVEKALAADAKAPAELRDALANYNKMATADLAGKVPVFPLARYLTDRGIAGPAAADIVVGQPRFFEGLQRQLSGRRLTDGQA